mgnify:CR=1 FL=1
MPSRRNAAPARPAPLVPRTAACRCGRPVFFRNSECLACHTALGYEPDSARLLPLEPSGRPGLWVAATGRRRTPRWRRCANLDTASGCNWLLPEADGAGSLCRSCRLTRTLPDLSIVEHQLWWGRIATAQRRLLSVLIALGLPTRSQVEDPQHGLAFDLLRQLPGGEPVMTGHADGVITLDVAEADDSQREQRRHALGEPYRTLLGHLRHESGHYYWQRLVDGTPWLAPCRALFGDDRADYAAALQRHYAEGPAADWPQRHVSAYASCHPWEDWAETWAHYLHLVDTLDTARGFALDGVPVELHYERWAPADLDTGDGGPAEDADAAQGFVDLVNGWMELTGVLNELSRSMGLADFYPFVLSRPALRKLHLVHRIVQAQRPQALLPPRQPSARRQQLQPPLPGSATPAQNALSTDSAGSIDSNGNPAAGPAEAILTAPSGGPSGP